MKPYFLLILFTLCLATPSSGQAQTNYLDYHQEVIKCEQLIAAHEFKAAIYRFDSLFGQFGFVFLRDCQLAAVLSAIEKNHRLGFRFLRLGVSHGWRLKDMQRNDQLKFFREGSQWQNLLADYDSLHEQYKQGLDTALRQEVHNLYKKDQKMALRVLIRVLEKYQLKYAVKNFAPHSEKQMAQLNQILHEKGYPGEQLIGNSWWASVILSHHNSISTNYNLEDTLYINLRPKLIGAIEKGELHPYEFATIEDWRIASTNRHKLTSYGFLGETPDQSTFEQVNRNRSKIGLRSIELRNALITIEEETGLNLYLPKGWQKGKIAIAE